MKVTLTFNEQRRAAYRQQGLWGDASLADYWQQTARAMPDKIAVVDNHGATYTYSALDHAASCLANWMLAKGIEQAIASHFNCQAGVNLPLSILPA